MLDVVEWRVLSYLAIVEGRGRDVILGALGLREEACDGALQQLKDLGLVSVTQGRDVDLYFIKIDG